MRPIQISEQNLNETVFGIDLGTTNSLIARINKNDEVEIFKDEQGRELLPSAISYQNNILKTGYDVGSNAIYSIKRLMGKSVKDLDEETIYFAIDKKSDKIIKIKCSEKKYLTPIEISSEILKALCDRVKKSIGMKVKKAVVTVPAYFDDLARNATKRAAKLAGIEVIRLINEPTAAALSYSIEKNNVSGIYAVYDLGGGTFDISILKLHQGVFQVLAVGGDTKLGGNDFDYLLSLIILDKYKEWVNLEKSSTSKTSNRDLGQKNLIINEHTIKLYDKSIVSTSSSASAFMKELLFTELYTVKEYLSENDSGTFKFQINDKLFECKITRKEFEKAISHLISKTIKIVTSTINEIDLKINDIKGIILVGGATRVPLVYKSLIKLFGNKKVLNDVDPDKAVVIGAALQAHYLTSSLNDRNVLLDVLPLSLGIETIGGIVEKIIPRNTPLPVSETKEFTTYADGQTTMKIHVCQGEREMIWDNKSLMQFELKGIPSLPAGAAKIEIEFIIDIDGILTVTAREKTTGIEQVVEINSNLELSEADVQNTIKQSIINFDEDIKVRSLAEAKVNYNRLMHSIKSNINLTSNQKLEKPISKRNKNLTKK